MFNVEHIEDITLNDLGFSGKYGFAGKRVLVYQTAEFQDIYVCWHYIIIMSYFCFRVQVVRVLSRQI